MTTEQDFIEFTALLDDLMPHIDSEQLSQRSRNFICEMDRRLKEWDEFSRVSQRQLAWLRNLSATMLRT